MRNLENTKISLFKFLNKKKKHKHEVTLCIMKKGAKFYPKKVKDSVFTKVFCYTL